MEEARRREAAAGATKALAVTAAAAMATGRAMARETAATIRVTALPATSVVAIMAVIERAALTVVDPGTWRRA